MNYLLLHSSIVIILAFSSFIFFSFTLKYVENHQKNTAKYFSLFFLFVALGFITFITRPFIGEIVSIILHYIFYIITVFCLRQGILIRSGHNPVPLHRNIWLYGNITLIFLVNIGLFYIIYDNLALRAIMFNLNLSLIVFSLIFVKPKNFFQDSPVNKLLNFTIIGLPIFNIAFPTTLYLSGLMKFYFTLMLPSHIIQVFIWTMVFTLVLLIDSLMGHYQKSITDGLSGLYNKQYFSDLIKQELRCDCDTNPHKKSTTLIENQMALIVLDIDYFKQINDTYGHTAGDTVIKEVSEQLRKLMTDNIVVSRFGGEEFTIFIKDLVDVSNDELFSMAEEIRQLLEQMVIEYGKHKIKLTASLGVASCMTGYSFDLLFKKADEALYFAKENGRNQVCLH